PHRQDMPLRRPGRYRSEKPPPAPARSSGHSDYPLGRGAVSLFSARSMDMTWLGHACVRMRGREGVVLADPPDPKSGHAIPQTEPKVVVPMSYDPDAKKDTHAPFDRLLHELGVKELTPVAKLSVTRSSLPENVQVVALDSRAR